MPCGRGSAAVRLSDGTEELADVVRALDSAGVRVADLKLHAPSLDDVFLAKTGRSLEGAQAEETSGEPEVKQPTGEPVGVEA